MSKPQFTTVDSLVSFLQAGNALSLVREGDERPRKVCIFWDKDKGQLGYFVEGIDCIFGLNSILTDVSIVKNLSNNNYTTIPYPESTPDDWNSLYKDDLLLDALAQKIEQQYSIFVSAHFPLGLHIFYHFRSNGNHVWNLRTGDSEYDDNTNDDYDSVFEMWLALIQAVKCPNSSISFEECEPYDIDSHDIGDEYEDED